MFRKAEDLPYTRFFRRLHSTHLLNWYLEIGCRTGRILSHVQGKTIAVDPYFQIERNVIGKKPGFFAFQSTSDAFFKTGFLERMGAKLDLSFIDGMHLIEFVLRDFINVEQRANPAGSIALHDCCPYNAQMTTRAIDNLPPGDWTGDVWKIIPILQEYRPDLTLTVLGCAPSGLLIVSGLDPQNTVLSDKTDEILGRFQNLSIEAHDPARFYDSFDYTPVQDILASQFAFLDPVALSPTDGLDPRKITP